MEFQVKMTYGTHHTAYLYFEVKKKTKLSKIKEKAIKVVKKFQKNKSKGFPQIHLPADKTISISEYSLGKRIKGGIVITTEYRK